jgi:hypothetical protein
MAAPIVRHFQGKYFPRPALIEADRPLWLRRRDVMNNETDYSLLKLRKEARLRRQMALTRADVVIE